MSGFPAVLCAALLAFAGGAWADAETEDAQPTPQRAFCHLLKACQIPDGTGTCTEKLSAPIPGIEHEQAYCGWVRSFVRRGIVPGTRETNEMFRYMGSRYHVSYTVADTLPIAFPALDLLLDNVPFTAKLINAYRGTAYQASFPDPADSLRFTGSSGRSLQGEARQVWARPDRRERVYYGVGKVNVLSWHLVGNVVIELRAWPAAQAGRTLYSARFTMFPVNKTLNTVMNMGVFRSVAVSKVQAILDDILQAAQAYSRGEKPVAPLVLTPAERNVLAEFARRNGGPAPGN